MKRIAIMTVFLLCLVQCMASCSKHYQADYPDNFTTEYCVQNYIYADPNLLYLERSENRPAGGAHHGPGAIINYYAIRNISPEEYLAMKYHLILSDTTLRIVKKSNLGTDAYEILTKEIVGAEIYKRTIVDDPNYYCAGTDCYQSQIAKLTDTQIEVLIEHIETSLDSQQYTACPLHEPEDELFLYYYYLPTRSHPTVLRVYFEEYQNMVWDALIVQEEGTYYIIFYVYDDSPEPSGIKPDKRWVPVLITLPEEIAALIPEK